MSEKQSILHEKFSSAPYIVIHYARYSTRARKASVLLNELVSAVVRFAFLFKVRVICRPFSTLMQKSVVRVIGWK